MKAAVYRGPGLFAVEDVPVPETGPGELLVRVDACGVCVTDIKKIDKGLLSGPRVFGHEIAGTVARAGAGCAYREGDRVVVHHHIPCGNCFYCARLAYAQCEVYKKNGTTAGFEPSGGGFAEYVKAFDWIAARGTIRIPDGVPPAVASFVEPVNTCLKAVRKAAVGRGETALVVGQGQIGLLLMQLCRWSGAEVLTSDTLADRLAMSRRLGAAAAFDALAEDVVKEARALTAGRGVDVAFVAAVGPQALDQAVSATRPGGRIMVFAATSAGETAEVDLGLLCTAEKDILTSYSASVEVQELAAQLVFRGEVKVADLVTHRFPLGQAPQAVELASKPAPGVLKVVIETGPGGEVR
ncbi:MAG TPA: zinc-binding dehydrogenase [Vicinamibacteria bacterium]|nr:zinc-binding dehydrogenase [Vicinamibacteria bacterium]